MFGNEEFRHGTYHSLPQRAIARGTTPLAITAPYTHRVTLRSPANQSKTNSNFRDT